MTKIKDDATPSVRQYLDIKQEYPDFLMFYRMGDFYELFFEDAIKAAKALDIVLTKRGSYQGEPIPMCGVPFHAYESYLARLIHQGFKVAICEQVETPEEAKKRGGTKAVVKREVVRLVTAGTLTEDNMLDARSNNYLLCCCMEEKNFGFAWIDLSTGDFYTKNVNFGIHDKEDVFQAFLSYIDACEIIVSDKMLRISPIFNILKRYQEKLTVLPQARFNVLNAKQMLEKFFNIQTLESFGSFNQGEVIAAGVALSYIETTQKGQLPYLKKPIRRTESQFLEIDSATRYNLELLKSVMGDNRNSLLGCINRTVTGAGSRLLTNRLINPSINIDTINERLNMIDFFIKAPEIRNTLRGYLRQTADLERIISRMSLNRCAPKEFASLGITLSYIPKIRNLIYNLEKYNLPLSATSCEINDKLKTLADFSVLVTEISEALKDEQDLPNKPGIYNFIRDGYNAQLDHLHNIQKNQTYLIEELEQKYIQQTKISSLKIKHTSVLGYFIEVPAKMAKDMIGMSQFLHRQSVLNGARFTTSELNDMEQELLGAQDKAFALEIKLYNDLIGKAMAVANDIYVVAKVFSELDIASSLADLAVEKNYVRPLIDDSYDFIVKEGRHPVVERAIEKSLDGTFINNDCRLNSVNDRIWLLTGPNMAGKSTFLRQNAIIAIMAQLGSYVPCSYAKIGVIDKVFSRVGASDDLSRGRSTFMVEMVETAAILNQATDKSFVILDEIGRGTATYDGLSIAWSVVEHLHEINKCRALFATHYHELTVLSNKLKELSLHCMKIKEFNGNVVFMHQVIEGATDRSYGIHVAKLAGLPAIVIKRAEQILKSLEQNPNNSTVTDIENDLPLFSVLKKEQKEKEEAVMVKNPALEMLEEINPDDLSPKEALEKIYELKKLA